VGRRLRLGYQAPDTEVVVVGVVADFVFGSMRFDPRAVMITSAPTNDYSNTLSLVLRTRTPEILAEPVRRAAEEAVPNVPRLSVVTGRDLVAADLGRERLGAWFFSAFGLVALALGIGGVFGLIAYLAESRRREFGIRIALGATPAGLISFALVAGLLPATLGAGAGLVGAMWVAESADVFLVRISRIDPLSYGLAFTVMLVVATIAGLAAAFRVRRISPVEALRAE
jgi:hypothetical protein